MRIAIHSDLHWERIRGRYPVPDLTPTDSDVVVLAGDIDEGVSGVEWAARQARILGKAVIYVPGNHEFWRANAEFDDVRTEMRREARSGGVHFLDNDKIIINGVRFLGTTLWSDYGGGSRDLMRIAWKRMRDFEAITAAKWRASAAGRRAAARYGLLPNIDDRPLPEFFLARHKASVKWLRDQIRRPFGGPTVVVSHHAPAVECLGLDKRSDLLDPKWWTMSPQYCDEVFVRIAAYASDLSALLAEFNDRIALWVHGHIHGRSDVAAGGVRIVCHRSFKNPQ